MALDILWLSAMILCKLYYFDDCDISTAVIRCIPNGSWGMPLKMMRYVVRKRAPSAGRMWGPPRRPPVASSLPSGSSSTRSPSDTTSSPGSRAGRRIFGWWKKHKNPAHYAKRKQTLYLFACMSELQLFYWQESTKTGRLSSEICVTESDSGNKFIIIMSNQSTIWPLWRGLKPYVQKPPCSIFKMIHKPTNIQEKQSICKPYEGNNFPFQSLQENSLNCALLRNNSCLSCSLNYWFSHFVFDIWTTDSRYFTHAENI